jgi:uncharacterized glyoxalase superfamily protein PhnB
MWAVARTAICAHAADGTAAVCERISRATHRTDSHLTLRYARRMADPLPSLPEQRMTFTALTPMLRSADLAAALAFYTDTLEFRLDSGGADAGWATLRHGSLALMLAAQQATTETAVAGFPGSLYFRTDDVDAWWQRLQPRARIAYPLEDFAYGMREFAIHDADGHLLQFGQALCR